MRRKITVNRQPIISTLLLTFIIIFVSSTLFPCQTFTLKKGQTLIVGHNLGNRTYVPGSVFINKRGVRKTAVSWQEILSGEKSPHPHLEWISRFGSVTFSPFCRDFPDGGMNEAGLYIGEMTLSGTRFPEDESKPLLFMMLWMQYVLDNFDTIDQVVQSLHDLTIDGWTWHFFTADRQGNSAVIEFLDGNVTVYKGDSLPYPILCNTRYGREIETIESYKGFGGEKRIDLNSRKQQRFIHGAQMIREFDPEKYDGVDYGFKILHQFDRGGTQWSLVCDLKKLKAYFRSQQSKAIKELDLKKFDLECGSPVKMIDYHRKSGGAVEEDFLDYNYEMNVRVMRNAIETLPESFGEFLRSKGSSVEQVIERLAGYSEKTICTSK